MLLLNAGKIAANLQRCTKFFGAGTASHRRSVKTLACAAMATLGSLASAVPFNNGTVDSTVVVDANGTGDYTSLADAATAFSAVSGINANWTILINSDLTETASSTFGNTVAADKTVTLRPAPGQIPTIAYTMTIANSSGINGGLLIGVTGPNSVGHVKNTDNFIVDGSNDPETDEKHLTIISSNQTSYADRVVHVIGGANGAIKNTNIISNAASNALSHFGIYFSSRINSGVPHVPTDWSVSNCYVQATSGYASQGIGCIRDQGTSELFQSGLHVSNCVISASTRGIYLNNNSNAVISENIIRVAQLASGFHSYGIWHRANGTASGWTVEISGNILDHLETGNVHLSGDFGITGMALDGTSGTYDVCNNMITGYTFAQSNSTSIMNYRGIACRLANTALKIRHNSINMKLGSTHVDANMPEMIAAISITGGIVGASSCDIRNNIINFGHNKGYVYYFEQLPTTRVIDYNVYGYLASSEFAYVAGTTFSTFAGWQQTHEPNGQGGYNPFTSAGSAWWSMSDLHFAPDTVYPAGLIAGTPIFDITTDIDGQPRSLTAPMPGCDEIVIPTPDAATEVAVSKVGESLQVTWTDNATNETGYRVLRSIDGSPAAELASLPADSTSYLDEDVNACSVYSYLIVVYNTTGEAPASNAASYDNGEIPVITVTGDNPATVQQFSAYTDAGATAADACGTDITGDIAVSSNVDVNAVGAYQVTYTVTDANGKEDTEVRTVNVVLGPVAAPTAVSAGAGGSSGEIVVTWTDNATNETGYRILRSVNGAAAVQVAEIAAGSTSYVDADINACSTYVYTVVAYHAEDDASATAAAYDNGQLPTVTVLGDAVVTIEVGTAYIDAGATAEDACGNALTPVASGSVNSATVGTYTITYTATDANSKQQSATRTVHVEDSNVEKVDQAITFGALIDKTYGDASITLSATASSGLPVSFTATGPATVSGSVLTITGAGTVTVTASQAGGPGFNPAPDVTRSFSVAKANASISVIGYNGTYDGQPHTATGTAQGIEAEPVDLTSLLHITGTFTAVPGGTATWTFDGNENYNPATGSASITIRSYLPLRPKTPTRP